jgi:hypothetical protein
MKSPRGRAWVCVAVFVAVTIAYECCPIKGAGDLFWSIPTVFSILREGNADLNEYQEGFHHYPGAVELVDGHYRNFGSSVGPVGFPRRMVVHDERRPT